jgi:hypothetical protein
MDDGCPPFLLTMSYNLRSATRTVPPSSPVAAAESAPATDIPRLDVDSVIAVVPEPAPAPAPAPQPTMAPAPKPATAPAPAPKTRGIAINIEFVCPSGENDAIDVYVNGDYATVKESYLDKNNQSASSFTRIDKDDLYDYLKAYITIGLMEPNNTKIAFTASFLPRVTFTREEMQTHMSELLHRLCIVADIVDAK